MSKTKEKFLIIDGHALIHRSFHALPTTMQTKNGEITNAIFGFTSFLLKAILEFKPKFIALTLDRKSPTFRHKLYKKYKANRQKTPDELYQQIPKIKKIAEKFKIPIFELDGFEADDLIGSITFQNEKDNEDIENIIITGDMDTLQLVSEKTKVYTMSRGITDSKIYNKEAIKEKYNLSPQQIIDYKSLRGDTADNIPGVTGIGEKGAINILNTFNTLDNLYKELEKNETKNLKPRIVDLLKNQKEQAFISYKLATIDRNVDIKFDLKQAKFSSFSKDEIFNLFSKLEFKSLLAKISQIDSIFNKEKENKFERNKKKFQYHLVNTEASFQNFIKKLKKEKEFTFDTETTGIDPMTCSLLGISFAFPHNDGEAYYIEIKTEKNNIKKNTEDQNLFNYQEIDNTKKNKGNNISHPFLKILKPIFENPEIKKNAHNIKYDLRVLKHHNIEIKGINFDTIIASYLLNPSKRQHNIDNLAFIEFGFEKISKDDLLGTGRDKIEYKEVETEKMSIYSCEDADWTQRLKIKLEKKLKKEANLIKLFQDIEIPLVEILANMEDNGISLDTKFLKNLNKNLNQKIKKIEKEIFELSKTKFNIKSTKQLKEILFEKLEITTNNIKKTKTGFSTSFDELEKIKKLHPIVPLIQNYRELNKLTSTYTEALPKLINPNTKRIHTNFNQTITATGRLSSTNPNLQNIPVKNELGKQIRKAFITSPGYKLVALDYSQIELRLAAHLSQDKEMLDAFEKNQDIHSLTAASINKIPLEDVDKNLRRQAKAINFGILYGQGPFGLSKTANISITQAKEFIEKYFEIYQGVKDYLEKTKEFAIKNTYVETILGRKRYIPEINSNTPMIKKAAQRVAINTPLQGSAADIIKLAMIEVDKYCKKINKDNNLIKMLIQVHDELIFEIKEGKIEEISKELKKIMENIITLKIPLLINAEIGENWGELNKLDLN